MEKELSVGYEIQMSMLPLTFPAFPEHKELEVFASLEPAREVGGEFYDFLFIDDTQFCFCIGDVSGKGVTEAMDVDRNLFEESRLVDLMSSYTFPTIEMLVQETVKKVKEFEGEAEQADDITVLGVKYLGQPDEDIRKLTVVIKNQLPEMANVQQSFDRFAEEHSIPQAVGGRMNMVFDEILSNVISYAYSDDDEHEIVWF